MNQTTIAGHLGADPEVRFTSSGKKVTTLRVAARVRRGAKDETIWWKVSIWGEEFDKMLTYFKKGSPIVIVGEMNKPEIFIDREGKPQISMSMTGFNLLFSPFGRPDQASSEGNSQAAPSAADVSYAVHDTSSIVYGQGKTAPTINEDEIPF
jgi:single-strand DNA-binding protein